MLYALATGIAPIHARGEYHGDIHDDNIMIRRQGIGFEVKLLDFFDLGRPTRGKIHKDVLNLIQVFHTIVGGRERLRDQAQGREGHHPRAEGFADPRAVSKAPGTSSGTSKRWSGSELYQTERMAARTLDPFLGSLFPFVKQLRVACLAKSHDLVRVIQIGLLRRQVFHRLQF